MRLDVLSAALSLSTCASAAVVHAPSKRDVSNQTKIPGFFTGNCTEEIMTVRKEWRSLSTAEQDSFLDSVQCLLNNPAQSGLTATTSRFSDLTALHRGMTNTAVGDIIHDVVS
jgi:tyrosinase